MKNLALLALCLPSLAVAASPIDFEYTNPGLLANSGESADAQSKAWFSRCVAGGQFADFAEGFAPDHRISREQRQAAEAGFDRRKFEAIAQQTYDGVIRELPQRQLTLCVDFAHPDDHFARDQMRGVLALTAGAGKVIVKLHPDADWATLLPYVLAHELHHSYWAAEHFDPAVPFTLADYLVFEGKADNFAKTLFGNHPAPWIDALDSQQYASSVAAFAPRLGEDSPELLAASMFGSPQAGIPTWAGYTVGYRWVAAKLQQTGTSDWKAITALPASAFIPAGTAADTP